MKKKRCTVLLCTRNLLHSKGKYVEILCLLLGRGAQSPNFIVLAAAIVCIVALLLPTDGDDNPNFPSYLHLSLHQKLIFAYTLGKYITFPCSLYSSLINSSLAIIYVYFYTYGSYQF